MSINPGDKIDPVELYIIIDITTGNFSTEYSISAFFSEKSFSQTDLLALEDPYLFSGHNLLLSISGSILVEKSVKNEIFNKLYTSKYYLNSTAYRTHSYKNINTKVLSKFLEPLFKNESLKLPYQIITLMIEDNFYSSEQ